MRKLRKPYLSHEIPKALFNRHDEISDYPYVLGHLLKLDQEYADFYKAKLHDPNTLYSILDNSAFELGESIPFNELRELALEYKPTHLVLPDRVHDKQFTMESAKEYLQTYSEDKQKYIGVCQGDTFEDIADMIDFYLKLEKVPIIALPYDLIKDSEHVTVRFRFILWWYKNRYNYYFHKNRVKFHLLGCENPVEFLFYKGNMTISKFIHSIDTSSPIVNGWFMQPLNEHGLTGPKPKAKLADNLDIELDQEQLELIFKNVKTFKSYVK